MNKERRERRCYKIQNFFSSSSSFSLLPPTPLSPHLSLPTKEHTFPKREIKYRFFVFTKFGKSKCLRVEPEPELSEEKERITISSKC
jgi:hypothetical protein